LRGAIPRRSRGDRQARCERGTPPQPVSRAGAREAQNDDSRRLDLWRQAQPIAGTPVETYLRARGFKEPPPATIRFLPRYPYSSLKSFACMIAAVQAPTREIVAVQLTFLHSGGQRKADVPEPDAPLARSRRRIAPRAGRGTYRPI